MLIVYYHGWYVFLQGKHYGLFVASFLGLVSEVVKTEQ